MKMERSTEGLLAEIGLIVDEMLDNADCSVGVKKIASKAYNCASLACRSESISEKKKLKFLGKLRDELLSMSIDRKRRPRGTMIDFLDRYITFHGDNPQWRPSEEGRLDVLLKQAWGLKRLRRLEEEEEETEDEP